MSTLIEDVPIELRPVPTFWSDYLPDRNYHGDDVSKTQRFYGFESRERNRVIGSIGSAETIEYLELSGPVNEELLEVVASKDTIRCLEIDGLRTDTVASLLNLKHLEKLSLLSCSKLSTVAGLSRLKKLKTLQIAASVKLQHLDFESVSESIRCLVLSGSSDMQGLKLESLVSLKKLTKLRHLLITNVRCGNNQLRFLQDLPLKTLGLWNGKHWPQDDIIFLADLGVKISITKNSPLR